jgi:predicted metal-dependent phosphoesterase TrpH
MLIDTHVHTTRYSPCSALTPVELVRRAEKLELSGIVITEHDHLWTQEEVEALKKETATDLLIMRGQEVHCSIGHLLVYGYYEELDYMTVEGTVEKVHEGNGIVLHAHPFRYGNTNLSLKKYRNMFSVFDGIEVLNGNQKPDENKFGLSLWKDLGIIGIGGSDAHSTDMLGQYVTQFENEIRNEEDLIREIKAGRCRPVRLSALDSQ